MNNVQSIVHVVDTKDCYFDFSGSLCIYLLRIEGFRGFARTPLPIARFKISHANEIFWSQLFNFHRVFKNTHLYTY